MVADEVYEVCLPVLQDEALEDDDRTDKLEQLLRKETGLTGKSLENVVLDCLWRFREAGNSSSSPPPSRHTVIRRPSPAPWQVNRAPTPVNHSPRTIHPPPGFGVAPPGFTRAKSSNASPFTSPRPSPRLAFSSPHIPHSPSLSAYQFSEGASPAGFDYGDYGSDTVDWLVNDDSGSTETSSQVGDGTLNGAAAEWVQPQTMDMSPYDMLRSILRDDRPDEEIEKALEANGYDLSATLIALMGSQAFDGQQVAPVLTEQGAYIVGRSMSPAMRPATPASQAKSNIVCKYFLSTGHCARADCRFSHDTSKTLCKYFMSGNCLAGDTCLFSHDPSTLMARLGISDVSTPPLQATLPNFQMQDYEAFPSLQSTSSPQWTPQLSIAETASLEQLYGVTTGATHPPPGLSPFPTFTPANSSRPQSRPDSRHHSRAATPSVPAVDDNEAFPTLGSAAAAKSTKRHHGKRGGHGHGNKDQAYLADIVRMSPSPNQSQLRKGLRPTKSFSGSRENSVAASAILAPEHIPWLETGENANKAYLQARAEAFKHGSLRNKFLQSAAQAWNRSDSRAAKALSLRGQSENNLMREAHREAARHLYEERNKDNGPNARELYVDLHGLHPDEAVSYLEGILLKHSSSSRPVYAITGTGHHSKNGKDKVGKAIRGFLNEWRYAFREFSVPGDRNNVGGILGIDPSSYDKSIAERAKEGESGSASEQDGIKKDTKVRIMKRDEVFDAPKGPKRAGS
ncbi:smr domain-containing protein [Lindgomyces ingoldianus]|uniref:Smr domain-containing protein n=1 Tax=Lindgomyces ingoldianus TaxID=673940 RepID=A0ACB6QMM8_9PLEO|nr:smr domain-containing protein [Lindgomyces ingoldianus]KAF2467562.1 smr domain-containing protein [Lindgomyces ingoldianus]